MMQLAVLYNLYDFIWILYWRIYSIMNIKISWGIFSEILTKAQSITAMLIVAFEALLPSQVVLAAEVYSYKEQPINGILLAEQVIREPMRSQVMLTDQEFEQKQVEIQMQKQEQSQKVVATTYMMVSAYNSLPNQTDGSPYHTAIGSMTRDGVVATNYFPIGTRIRFPDIYGDKEFRVEDRMNPRYSKTVDIWMEDLGEARKFGRRYLKVDIVKYGFGRGME